MKHLLLGTFALMAVASPEYDNKEFTKLDNTEYWKSNGNGSLTKNGDIYTMQQNSEKSFNIESIKDIDFSKEYIVSFDIKLIEGEGFYISLNGNNDLKDDLRIEISNEQISINRWFKESAGSIKIFKKKLSSKLDPRNGLHINLKQGKYKLYIKIRSNVPGTYDYKSYDTECEIKADRHAMGMGLIGENSSKAEVSYFNFTRPTKW